MLITHPGYGKELSYYQSHLHLMIYVFLFFKGKNMR